jgi:adenylate cyclase, class 2
MTCVFAPAPYRNAALPVPIEGRATIFPSLTIPLRQPRWNGEASDYSFVHGRILFLMATNLETEIKLRVLDLPDLLRRFRKMGARSHGRVFEENTLYDTPDANLRRNGWLLRLRIETAKSGHRSAKLTSKAPLPRRKRGVLGRKPARRHKEKLESEVNIRHPTRAARLLRKIGLRPSFRYEKYRTSFHLGRLHLDLDQTPVGTFLELEGRPAAIDRAARSLGYSARDYIRCTYWDLYAANCRRRGRTPQNMVFARKNPASRPLFA